MTAGVGDGPTETWLDLYWSILSGVAGPQAQDKKQSSPKNGLKLPILCQKKCYLGGIVSCRAPYPFLRVPDPLNRVGNCLGATYWVLQGCQHKKNQLSYTTGEKMPNFGRKQCIFGEQWGRRNPPLLSFGCIIIKKKVPFGTFG